MTSCPKCGSPIISPEQTTFCAACNYVFLGGEAAASNPQPVPVIIKTVPWETPEQMGIFKALIDTLEESIIQPGAFFGKVAQSQKNFSAWLYALILGSFGAIFSYLWTLLIFAPLLHSLQLSDNFAQNAGATSTGLLFAPLIITAGVLCSTLYFHVLLFLTRSGKQGIKATFRVVCYSQGTAIFEIIPIIGPFLAALWALYLLAVGFSKVHRISMFRTIVIILLPLVVLFVLAVIVVVLIASAGFLTHDVLKGLPFDFR
jgi:hypothetical protein